MSMQINFYQNLSKNLGQINGYQMNGAQINSSQYVGGDMNGDQINHGQLNGGQLNNSQSSGGQMNGGQSSPGHLVGSQSSGVKMLSVRDIEIEHIGNDKESTKWVPKWDSRFVGEDWILIANWLKIKVTIKFIRLSAETNYAAHLIFKTMPDTCCLDTFQEASVSVGDLKWQKVVCIKPSLSRSRNKYIGLPIKRSDGWMEVELGQFYCAHGAGEVVVSFQNINCDYKDTLLLVAGIEVRHI